MVNSPKIGNLYKTVKTVTLFQTNLRKGIDMEPGTIVLLLKKQKSFGILWSGYFFTEFGNCCMTNTDDPEFNYYFEEIVL